MDIVPAYPIPAVRTVLEAETSAHRFASVVSLVPDDPRPLAIHPNRLLRPFADVFEDSHPRACSPLDAAVILEFTATAASPLLVHCRAGQSRSTAVALAVMVQHGWDPEAARDALLAAHPPSRPFIPNLLVLARFDALLGMRSSLFAAGTRWRM